MSIWSLLDKIELLHGQRQERPTQEIVTYTQPGAPPTGRRVAADRIENPMMWIRVATPKQGYEWRYGAWVQCAWSLTLHRWVPDPDAKPMPWCQLLDRAAPLVLVPLTMQEEAEEGIYGPLGARWGDPDTPCPYAGCVWGTGHIGPHRDAQAMPLGETVVTEHATGNPTAEDRTTFCTCGTPAHHQPHCPRYARMTGEATHVSD